VPVTEFQALHILQLRIVGHDRQGIGLTPYEALRASTTHPFEYLGELDASGTVQVGKRADLVLLQDNPLTDIANSRKIEGVMLGGRWLSKDQIQSGLASLELASPIR